MKTAREILIDKNPYSVTAEFESDYVVSFDEALEAMKEYASQAIDKCAEEATSDLLGVDRDSILKVKDQLK